MGKYLPTLLKLLAGLLLLAALGLYLFRVTLVDALLVGQLSRLGVPVNSLAVEEVSLNELELGELSLGAASELRADKVTVTWTLPGLLKGELRTLEISGLRLALDLSGENPPLGSLQKLTGSGGDNEDNRLPRVSLLDAKADLHTTAGDFTVELNGAIEPGPSGTILVDIDIDSSEERGQLTANLSATLEAGGNLQGLVTVSEAALSLPDLNISAIRGQGSFAWSDNRPQAISADIALSHISLPGAAPLQDDFQRGEFTLQMNATDVLVEGELSTAQNARVIALAVALNDYPDHPGVVADVSARVDADSVIWRLTGLSPPDRGSASLTLKADGKLPELLTAGDDWRSWLRHSTLRGRGILGLDGLGFAQKTAGLNGDVEIETEWTEGRGKLTLAQHSSIEASGLDPGWVERLGIPAAMLTELKQGTRLRIDSKGENSANVTLGMPGDGVQMDLATDLELIVDKARADLGARAEVTIDRQNQVTAFRIGEIDVAARAFRYAGNTIDKLTLRGDLQGSAETWGGELNLAAEAKRFHLEQVDARMAHVNLPMRVDFEAGRGRLSLRKPGQVAVAELAPLEAFRVRGPLKLDLAESDVRFAWGSGGLSLQNRIIVQPDSFILLVKREDAPALEMEIQPGMILHNGTMETAGQFNGESIISGAGMDLPQYQMRLEEITTTINHAESGGLRLADFHIGRLQHMAPKPYFAPIGLSGSVKLERERLSIDAVGGIPDNQYLKLTVEHGLDTGEGHLRLDVAPLTFSPGALQPAALFPALAMLKSVSGSVGASNHISWLKTGIESGAGINLRNLSFARDGTRVSGLSAGLQMTDLLSPKSLPRQKITVRRIEHGIPMEDIEILYRIEGAGSAQLAIDSLRLSMIGGTLSTGPVVFDPLSSSTSLVLEMADLDLEALFELIDVEGLAGDGRLDGSIPLTLSDDSVSIENGVLAAKKPGTIRLKSEKLSQILAGSAEDVDLLLQALTDFHYTELILKLNNSANNDLLTTLSLLGNNPKVLEGRLFRLNINLESNIGDILRALAQAYGVSSEALQRAFRLH